MNEFDRVNIYSMQSKLKEDQNYKLNKIVYDCVSSSPFYAVKDYYSNLNLIQHDRRPISNLNEKNQLFEKIFRFIPPFYDVSS